jgi:AcrR family transcriptional regulator
MTSAALREQQTQLTRDLIMDALADLVVEHGLQDLSVQQVADHAGVSHRTVYRHYPSRQALLDALADWLTESFEKRTGSSEEAMFDDLARSVRQSFQMMDEFDRHMRAYVILMTGTGTTAARRTRRTDKVRRTVERGPAKDLPRADARAVSALVRSMISSSSWHQMTSELGLDGPTAGSVVGWAIEVLFDELERGGGPALNKGEK